MSTVKNTIRPLVLAFSHVFRRVFTAKYPYEAPSRPSRCRGRIMLRIERCISCGTCEKICPNIAIKMVKLKGSDKLCPQIDFGRCMFCYFCVSYCPAEALIGTELVEISVYSKEKLIYPPEKLAEEPKWPDLLPKPKRVKLRVVGRRGAGHVEIGRE